MDTKSCPKCGTWHMHIDTWYVGDNPIPSYRVMCGNGHAFDAWSDTEEEAIADWNDQPHIDMLEARIIELENQYENRVPTEWAYEQACDTIKWLHEEIALLKSLRK